MASIVQLKRSALSGKVPDTGSLNLGELAVNTYDGKIYFKKSGSIESVESVVTTNSVITGSIRLEGTGSFGSLQVNDTLTVNHGVSVISGSLGITSDLTVLGSVNARQFNIAIISSSTLFESGSSNFGNSLDDTHTFTGSVNITGSFLLNGQEVGGGTTTGSFTGSFTGDGSGLRGVVSDDLPIDGWDYDSNSSASISEFNNESRKYLIDFQWDSEVGTPVGFKTFISNVTGSTQIVPTEEGIKFIVGNQQVALVGPNGIESVSPAGTVSGSSQLTSSALATTGSNLFVGTQTHSGSILPAVSGAYDLGSTSNPWRHIYVGSGSIYLVDDKAEITKTLTANTIVTTTDIASGSINLTESLPTGIVSHSAQIIHILNDLNSYTSSNDLVNSTQNIRLGLIETNTGSTNTRLSIIENKTGSFATTGSNTFYGTQTFSGSLYVANDLIVQGSSSIQYISASSVSIGTNIVQLNTANPSVRYAGLTIIDSGSVGGSGSFLYDSVQDEFIFVHRGNGTNITSSHFVLGPETYDSLGNEIYLTNNRLPKGTGKEHLVDSNILDDGTTISLGSNVNITGSITISGNVDGVDVSVLNSNINTFSSSALTRLTALEVETANLESFTSSINTTIKTRLNAETVVSGSSQITFSGISSLPTLVSGSSQVTLSSTTGYGSVLNQAVLTSSTPTFTGVKGSSYFDAQANGGFRIRNAADTANAGGFTRRGLWEGNANYDPAIWAETGNGLYFYSNGSGAARAYFDTSGHFVPGANNTYNLGSASVRWANLYTNDLHLSNEDKVGGNDVDGTTGNWTIQEGEEHLYIINNKTGKKFKFSLEEIQ